MLSNKAFVHIAKQIGAKAKRAGGTLKIKQEGLVYNFAFTAADGKVKKAKLHADDNRRTGAIIDSLGDQLGIGRAQAKNQLTQGRVEREIARYLNEALPFDFGKWTVCAEVTPPQKTKPEFKTPRPPCQIGIIGQTPDETKTSFVDTAAAISAATRAVCEEPGRNIPAPRTKGEDWNL